MLYNMCKITERHPTWQQLEHAIKRNFGGFESGELKPFIIFEKYLVDECLKVRYNPDTLSNEVNLYVSYFFSITFVYSLLYSWIQFFILIIQE